MKNSAWMMKEKKDAKKNKKSEERDEGKSRNDHESSSKKTLPNKQKQQPIHGEQKMQSRQIKMKERSSSKLLMKDGKDADDDIQQGKPEIAMLSSNNIDLIIKPLDKNKEKTYKEVTQNERLEEQNESKRQKEQDGSFEDIPQNQQQQQDDISGELELNIATSKDSLPENIDHTLKDNNIDNGSKLPISDERDENYYRLKQGIPRSTKFRSITDIYKCTNRLSSSEDESNWSRPSPLENKEFELHNEGKTRKDRKGIFEETLTDKQKEKAIHGEFESLSKDSPTNNSNCTLMNNNDNNINDKIDEDCHLNKGISKNTMVNLLFDLCKVTQNDVSEEHNISNIKEDQKNSSEEELPDQQQQQQQEDTNGKSELNKVTCEESLSNNTDRILNDNNVNYGSKLLTRDEKDGGYYITQGIPRSIKFRSITNLYKCTNRISPVEDEYNWNIQTEDPNTNLSTKEDSSIITNKENVGCKRKWKENQNGSGEKDAMTSST